MRDFTTLQGRIIRTSEGDEGCSLFIMIIKVKVLNLISTQIILNHSILE